MISYVIIIYCHWIINGMIIGLFIQNLWVPGDPLVLALVRRRAPGRRLGGRRLSAAAPRGVRGGRRKKNRG